MDNNNHFAGSFLVCNELFIGDLIYNSHDGVILLNIKRAYDADYPREEAFGNIDVITGTLNTGTKVTLFNNQCINNRTLVPQYHEYQFVSTYMIWADSEVVRPSFNCLIFTIENGLRWSELSLFDDDVIYGLKYTYEIPKRIFNWFGSTITFQPTVNGWNQYPRSEEINIIQRLQISIESIEKQDLDFFIAVRDKIISMICFAIKGNVNIDRQYCIYYEKYACVADHKDYIKHYLYTSEPKRNLGTTNIWHYNFKLSQLQIDNDYNDIFEKLVPVFNLCMSLYRYNDMPTEMVFLNVIQAIETFHARFFYNDNVNEYVEYVERRFSSSSNYEQIQALLLSGNQKLKKSIHLKSRINDLLLNSDVRLFLRYCFGHDADFAQKIVDTRNYYTHYSENKEKKALKGEALSEAIFVLRLLLEYNICLMLGIDNKEKIQDDLSTYQTWKYISKHQSQNKGKTNSMKNESV